MTFNINNLPFGVTIENHIATRLNDNIIDIYKLIINFSIPSMEIFKEPIRSSLLKKSLNKFISLEKKYWIQTRNDLQVLLSNTNIIESCATNSKLVMPLKVKNYTDFYTNEYHASNMSMIYRNTKLVQPNWYNMPIGYNGRNSSINTTDESDIAIIHRPKGQILQDEKVIYRETDKLDFELEIGIIVGGKCNKIGETISINNASDNIFGFVILNDLSARDIQKYEYVPLGPFNGKNFSTLISPWIITELAVEPFSINVNINENIPEYLSPKTPNNIYPIELFAELNGKIISKTNYKSCHWTPIQLITHHASAGCNLIPGDLLGSGTISDAFIETEGSDRMGSLIEMTFDGKYGDYLKDGDILKIFAICSDISFGHVTCKIKDKQ